MRPHGSSTELEGRRRLAVQRVNEGWKQKDVAAFLGVSDRAVRGRVAAYRKAGDEGLASDPHPGPAPKLTRRREHTVLSWLAKSPQAFGNKTDLWTTKRLAEVIAKGYGVRFNSNNLAEWLTRRGYSPQKPEVRAVERDEPAIARWAVEDWPGSKKARDDRSYVVLIDESGFFLNPLARRTWAPRGHTPVLTGFGRHRQKVSTIAAISVTPGRRRLGLYWKTDPVDYIDAPAVVGFLRDLLRHLKGKAIVVWDGDINHKSRAIRALRERYPRLTLERLPGYAPDLNPVEMLWAYLKHGMMANFVPADVLDLERVVLANLTSVRAEPKLIRSLWSGSDLPFPDRNLAI